MTRKQKALKLKYGRRLAERIYNSSYNKQCILICHRPRKEVKLNWYKAKRKINMDVIKMWSRIAKAVKKDIAYTEMLFNINKQATN